MSERYLVTGGCGLQGSHIVEQLLSTYPDSQIFVVSRHPNENRFEGVTYIRGDTTSEADIAAAFEHAKPTVVFHVAGLNLGSSPEQLKAVNLDATRVLLAQSEKSGVKAFIFTSSSSVISGLDVRDIKQPINDADETWPMAQKPIEAFMHPYTKVSRISLPACVFAKGWVSDGKTDSRLQAESERLVAKADRPGGMRTVSVRSALIYGERDGFIIPTMMNMFETGQLLLGDGTNVVSFTYAGNSARAQLELAKRLLENPDGVAGETFHVTDKEKVSWKEMAESCQEVAQIPVPASPVEGSQPPSGVLAMLANKSRNFKNDKVERTIGWQQPISQKEGVRRSVKVGPAVTCGAETHSRRIQWYLEHKKA